MGFASRFGINVKITVSTANKYPFAPDDVVIGSQQKVDCMARTTKLRAVETSDCAATDYRDLHGSDSRRTRCLPMSFNGIKKALRTRSECLARMENGLLGAENGVFGGLGDSELHNFLGGNLDGLTGGRIAALTSLTIHEHELSQPGQGEAVLGVLVSQLSNVLENFRGLLLGDSSFVRDRGSDLRLRECFCHSLNLFYNLVCVDGVLRLGRIKATKCAHARRNFRKTSFFFSVYAGF